MTVGHCHPTLFFFLKLALLLLLLHGIRLEIRASATARLETRKIFFSLLEIDVDWPVPLPLNDCAVSGWVMASSLSQNPLLFLCLVYDPLFCNWENLLGVVHADATAKRCTEESTSHKLGRADLGILNLGMESYCGSPRPVILFLPKAHIIAIFSSRTCRCSSSRSRSSARHQARHASGNPC